ncbi:MAG: hypothetical protein IPL73_23795 [Candidatus Obscuribacter sp.]|nr:hypothetical protein [Candidatus Obscuribacter sp.]
MAKNTAATPMIVLNLGESGDNGEDRRPHGHKGGCRPHVVICPGYGAENFPFPNEENLVVRALARHKHNQAIARAAAEAARRAKTGDSTTAPADEDDAEDFTGGGKSSGHGCASSHKRGPDLDHSFIPGLPGGKVPKPASIIPQLEKAREADVDGTLLVAAGGLRELLEDGKYDAIVAERFDEQSDKVSWARENMDPKYLPAIDSLDGQLMKLRRVYLAALPRTLDGLRAQNPGAGDGRLLEAAIQVLDEELTPIINVLRIWTDAFGQQRSGKYHELDAVVFSVEQAHYLFDGNDPTSSLTAELKTRLNTKVYGIGNLYVARFSGEGPATLPGTRGPIGAHAIEVPHDERNFITLMLILYMHEFRHDIFHDVEGLADELSAVVAKSILDAEQSGELKLSKAAIKIGRQSVPTANLLVKLMVDTIGEVDADISGGVLLGGPAYLFNMLSTFSAFNSKRRGVFNTPKLLRTESNYELAQVGNGQVSLTFLPHPPDYIRAHIVAAALDEIGFNKEATQCRALADQGVGFGNIPEYITWRSTEGKKDHPVIQIPVKDIQAVAPIVARALIRSQLKSLGGVSTAEVINWTPEREAKAQMLAKMLMEGKSELPTDKGDIHVTYVISAATLAYWGLCKSGYQPRTAAAIVEDNALKMIDQVRERFEARMAEVKKLTEATEAAQAQTNGGAAGEAGEATDGEIEDTAGGDAGGAPAASEDAPATSDGAPSDDDSDEAGGPASGGEADEAPRTK